MAYTLRCAIPDNQRGKIAEDFIEGPYMIS
jgi:hypothetical protein